MSFRENLQVDASVIVEHTNHHNLHSPVSLETSNLKDRSKSFSQMVTSMSARWRTANQTASANTRIRMGHIMKVISTAGLCGGNVLSNTRRRVIYRNMRERLMKGLTMESEFCITRMEWFIRVISYREQNMDMEFSYMVLKSINACT